MKSWFTFKKINQTKFLNTYDYNETFTNELHFNIK